LPLPSFLIDNNGCLSYDRLLIGKINSGRIRVLVAFCQPPNEKICPKLGIRNILRFELQADEKCQNQKNAPDFMHRMGNAANSNFWLNSQH